MAYDWLGWAIPAATALAQGYMAKKNTDSLKADAKHQQNEWERAMQLQQQNIYEARNSPFAKVGMTMLDQMLHVYGDQSKGRGGFTLPVDQLSSMLGGFGSFGNAENRQTIAGANPDASTGWYTSNGNPGMGGDSVSPQMRELIEQRKALAAQMGIGGRSSDRPLTQYRVDSVYDGGTGVGGFFGGGGGGGGFAEERARTLGRLEGMMRASGAGAPGSMGENPSGNRSFGDRAQDLAWRYMLADGSMGGRGSMGGEAIQGALRYGANTLTGGPLAGLGMGAMDNFGPRWNAMWEYDNPEASYLDRWISDNSLYNVYNGRNNPYIFGDTGINSDGNGYFFSGAGEPQGGGYGSPEYLANSFMMDYML